MNVNLLRAALRAKAPGPMRPLHKALRSFAAISALYSEILMQL